MDIDGNDGGAAGIPIDFKEKYQCFMLRCKKICMLLVLGDKCSLIRS